ncbi:hypothetical protein OAM67_00220 [bacterium]|nr:hypothetical protein [bacterium]
MGIAHVYNFFSGHHITENSSENNELPSLFHQLRRHVVPRWPLTFAQLQQFVEQAAHIARAHQVIYWQPQTKPFHYRHWKRVTVSAMVVVPRGAALFVESTTKTRFKVQFANKRVATMNISQLGNFPLLFAAMVGNDVCRVKLPKIPTGTNYLLAARHKEYMSCTVRCKVCDAAHHIYVFETDTVSALNRRVYCSHTRRWLHKNEYLFPYIMHTPKAFTMSSKHCERCCFPKAS